MHADVKGANCTSQAKFQGEVTPWLGRVVQKPLNANIGLKVYRSINLSSDDVFHFFFFSQAIN